MSENTGPDSIPNQVHLSLQGLDMRHPCWLKVFFFLAECFLSAQVTLMSSECGLKSRCYKFICIWVFFWGEVGDAYIQ